MHVDPLDEGYLSETEAMDLDGLPVRQLEDRARECSRIARAGGHDSEIYKRAMTQERRLNKKRAELIRADRAKQVDERDVQ